MAAVTADIVLQQLNSDFERSKSEQIHRFLRDQEELNQTISGEITDLSEDESDVSDTETLLAQRLDLYRVRPQSAKGWQISQPGDCLSEGKTSDAEPDILVCIGDRKPLMPEREGSLWKEGHQTAPRSRETSLTRIRSRSKNRAQVGKENDVSSIQRAAAEATSKKRERSTSRKPSKRGQLEESFAPQPPPEDPPALSRRDSFRRRFNKPSQNPLTKSDLSLNIYGVGGVMRPRTSTGLGRPKMSESDLPPNMTLDCRGESDQMQRLRNSAPASLNRLHKVVFDEDRSYLRVGESGQLLTPRPSADDGNMGLSRSNVPVNKGSASKLDNIFVQPKKVPSYSESPSGPSRNPLTVSMHTLEPPTPLTRPRAPVLSDSKEFFLAPSDITEPVTRPRNNPTSRTLADVSDRKSKLFKLPPLESTGGFSVRDPTSGVDALTADFFA